jgi:predicted CoA-binding protein
VLASATEVWHDGGMGDLDGLACPISPPGSNHAPDDETLARLLAGARTVAVVGLSPNPERTSHEVAAWLLENTPFEIHGVNPVAAGREVLGRPLAASLADLDVVPDIVDVFRRADAVPPVVDDAIAVGAPIVWMQLGIVNEEAAARGRGAGLTVVQNRCIKVEYARLRPRIVAGS